LWYSGIVTVTTTSGLFSVSLGAPPMNPLPDDLFGGVPQSIDTTRYLGITVGAEPEMSPRTKLTSTPYAFHALRADSADVAGFVGTDGVGTGALQDSSVTAVKLAPGAATAIGELVPFPGNASTTSTDPVSLYGVTVSVPGPGKLRLMATGQVYLNADATSSNSVTSYLYLGLCDDPDDDASCDDTYKSIWFQDADNVSISSVTKYFAIARVIDIPSAGLYTFWLNGNTSNPSWELFIWNQIRFNATFAPRELEMSVPLKIQNRADDRVRYDVVPSDMQTGE
jgi:hypothetical protein